MTRGEASNQINDIKTELVVHLLKKDIEALDMAISVLSIEGEYIKKEEALQALHDFWDECINFDGSGTELMLDNEGVIDSLQTYSFPNSVENKGEWILVVDSYFKDGTIEENHWECSKCGSDRSGWGEFKFCPDCGADMSESKGEKAREQNEQTAENETA